MQELIYDVAVSADGFIAGPDEDVSRFPDKGPIVADYLERLQSYAACIMGRRTYTFGYRFGLAPGARPYRHMRTLVVSKTLKLPANAAVDVVRDDPLHAIDALKREAEGPVYLCGGGALAGWLLHEGRIDRLRLKRSPILLGSGTPLLGGVPLTGRLRLTAAKDYGGGCLFQEFAIERAARAA